MGFSSRLQRPSKGETKPDKVQISYERYKVRYFFLGTKVSLVIGLFRMTGSNIDKVAVLLKTVDLIFCSALHEQLSLYVCSKLSWVTRVKGDFLSQCLRMFLAYSLALPLFTWSQGFDTSALFFFFFGWFFHLFSFLEPKTKQITEFQHTLLFEKQVHNP